MSSTDSTPSDNVLASCHILLVEDCTDQSRLYLRQLVNVGAEVTLECNGMSGFETFSKSPDKFDLVVLDFEMPELDGLEVTQAIRAVGSSIPIIGITAHHQPELEEKWRATGCNCYLKKPLAKNELVASAIEWVNSLATR